MESKFIVFEGLDNCGKDTQIKKLMAYFAKNDDKPTQIVKFSGIEGLDKKESKSFSKMLYVDIFKLFKYSFSGNKRNIILNRSWLGEYVYAPLYRKYKGEYVFKIEQRFSKYDFFKNIYLIVFVDDSGNAYEREDGSSLSKGDLDLIEKEKAAFIDAYNKSIVNKKILINISGMSIDEVHSKVLDFISK